LFSSQFSLSILKNVLIKSNKVLILNKVELWSVDKIFEFLNVILAIFLLPEVSIGFLGH
jgi:hypothetical protein